MAHLLNHARYPFRRRSQPRIPSQFAACSVEIQGPRRRAWESVRGELLTITSQFDLDLGSYIIWGIREAIRVRADLDVRRDFSDGPLLEDVITERPWIGKIAAERQSDAVRETVLRTQHRCGRRIEVTALGHVPSADHRHVAHLGGSTLCVAVCIRIAWTIAWTVEWAG